MLFADHVLILVAAEFLGVRPLIFFLLFGLVMSTLPIICITGGRYWPYLFVLPIVAVPIAGKTLRELSYRSSEFPLLQGWIYLVAIPLAVTLLVAVWLARRAKAGQTSRQFARIGLLLTTWLYFGLNFGFFRFPWPWEEWTGRTLSGLIFTVCAVSLTAAALFIRRPPELRSKE